MRALASLGLVVTLGAGCDSSQTIRQNGLVPRAHADVYDGQPLTHAFQFEGHAEGTPRAPSPGMDGGNGASVATSSAGGALRVAAGQDTDVGLLVDYAFARGAVETNNNPVPPPDSGSIGVGVALRRSLPLGEPGDPEGWRIGVGGSFTAWAIERREEGGGRGTNAAPIFAFSVVPSRRFGAVTAFGSVTVMNQIRVPASYIEGTGNDPSTDPASLDGGVAAVFGLGARIAVGENLGLLVQASESLGAQGGDAPMLGAAVMIGGGDRRPLPEPAPGGYR